MTFYKYTGELKEDWVVPRMFWICKDLVDRILIVLNVTMVIVMKKQSKHWQLSYQRNNLILLSLNLR